MPQLLEETMTKTRENPDRTQGPLLIHLWPAGHTSPFTHGFAAAFLYPEPVFTPEG